MHPKKLSIALTLALAGIAGTASADAVDFGLAVQQHLESQSKQLFGVDHPLGASAPLTTGAYRTSSQTAADQLLFADGLSVEFVTRESANNTDQMFLWPNATNPTHIITAVEEFSPHIIGTLPSGISKWTPSVQRINLATGKVETILRGLAGGDGIRLTPWGTVLITEETTGGAAYEIIDPLNVTNHTVTDRAAGTIVDADNVTSTLVVKRSALPAMAWEGLAVLPSGVVIAGDELRPGGTANADGGALFKFVPSVPRAVDAGFITNLSQSPLAAGSVYALQVSCRDTTQQYGQGCEIGNGAWVTVDAATARDSANTAGATGYYRPEDLELDPAYIDAANAEAIRFCWTNTGNEAGKNYAEVMCGVDSAPLTASSTQRTVTVNRFVEGDSDFNSFDNIAFQPVAGNTYVIEDHDNGDVWACLPDGADRDIKTDGCVKILSVKDSSAEPTGFFFTPDGKTAYVNIQHSDDALMTNVDDYGTDDLIKITGFKIKKSQ